MHAFIRPSVRATVYWLWGQQSRSQTPGSEVLLAWERAYFKFDSFNDLQCGLPFIDILAYQPNKPDKTAADPNSWIALECGATEKFSATGSSKNNIPSAVYSNFGFMRTELESGWFAVKMEPDDKDDNGKKQLKRVGVSYYSCNINTMTYPPPPPPSHSNAFSIGWEFHVINNYSPDKKIRHNHLR